MIPYGINLQGGVRYYVDWDKKLTSEAIKQKTKSMANGPPGW